MNRHELTDQQWERIAPLLLPEQTGKPGRPYKGHRLVINGILWIGAPWRDLPERYGQHIHCMVPSQRFLNDTLLLSSMRCSKMSLADTYPHSCKKQFPDSVDI
jgi:transposase